MAIYLLIFAFILFLGMRRAPKGEFNEDFLSLKVSKGIQGFCAICIVTHHFAQYYIYGGNSAGILSLFGLFGFLFVGVFFFFSGYGLFKSYKTKPDYLKGFLRKRLAVVLVPLYIVNTIITIITLATDGKMYNDINPLVMGMNNLVFKITTFLGLTLMNTNLWYLVTIAVFYVAFYLIFKHSKNEDKAFKNMGIFSIVYLIVGTLAGHGFFWFQGEYWYNSSLLLFIGMYAAKNEDKVISFIKRKYVTLLTCTSIFSPISTIVAIIVTAFVSYYRPGLIGRAASVICLIFETLATILFVAFILILTMKLRFNNKILDFIGKIALEVYVVHRFFLCLFNSEYITISNRDLNLAAIYASSIIVAVILHKIDGKIVHAIAVRKLK